MLYFLCAAAGVFFYSATINAMEVQQADSYSTSTMTLGGHLVHKLYGYFSSSSLNKDDIKKYPAQGITTIVVNGNNGGPRIKLNIKQITDEHVLEEAVVHADKNILSSVVLNRDGNTLDIQVCQLDQKIDRDIKIDLFLKKYTKIITYAVDTTFLSLIETEALHISLSSDATMVLPSIKAKTVELLAKDNSVLKVDKNARITAQDLLFIDKEGLASLALEVETQLLQAQSRGNGDISVGGNAMEQMLLLCKGSYFGLALQSQRIRIAQGEGCQDNKLELSAQESISGYALQKTNYEPLFEVDDQRRVQISPITEGEWATKFAK